MALGPRALCCVGSLISLLATGCPQFQQKPRSGLDVREYVEIGRERIFVKDRGEGPVVVLIHGYCGSSDHWSKLVPALVKTHRVLAVDLPGFARSDKYAGDYSPDAMAARLFRLLELKGVTKAHLVAHSWGTSIALAMALQQPRRVASVTLIGVWAYEDQLPPYIVWSRAPGVGEVLFTLFFDQRLDDRMGLTFHDVDAHIDPGSIERARATLALPGHLATALAAVRGMRFGEMERRYATLPQRFLILHGEHDPVTRLPWARRLDRELPDSRLVLIPDAKHMAMYTQAPKVLRALRPFLAGLEPGQAVVPRRPPAPAPATMPAAPAPSASAPAVTP